MSHALAPLHVAAPLYRKSTRARMHAVSASTRAVADLASTMPLCNARGTYCKCRASTSRHRGPRHELPRGHCPAWSPPRRLSPHLHPRTCRHRQGAETRRMSDCSECHATLQPATRHWMQRVRRRRAGAATWHGAPRCCLPHPQQHTPHEVCATASITQSLPRTEVEHMQLSGHQPRPKHHDLVAHKRGRVVLARRWGVTCAVPAREAAPLVRFWQRATCIREQHSWRKGQSFPASQTHACRWHVCSPKSRHLSFMR